MNPKNGQLAQLVRSIGLIIRRLGFKSLTVYHRQTLAWVVVFSFHLIKKRKSGCNSVGRMRDLGSRCRGFKSLHSDHGRFVQYSFTFIWQSKRKESTNMPSVSYRLRWGCCNIQKVSNDLNREWLDSTPIEVGSAGRFVHNTRHQNIRAYGMVTIGQFYKLPSTSGLSHRPFTAKSAVQICLGVPASWELSAKLHAPLWAVIFWA